MRSEVGVYPHFTLTKKLVMSSRITEAEYTLTDNKKLFIFNHQPPGPEEMFSSGEGIWGICVMNYEGVVPECEEHWELYARAALDRKIAKILSYYPEFRRTFP